MQSAALAARTLSPSPALHLAFSRLGAHNHLLEKKCSSRLNSFFYTKLCPKLRWWRYAGTLAMKPCGLVMRPLIFSEGRHYANVWL
jgi:hypothetical protein